MEKMKLIDSRPQRLKGFRNPRPHVVKDDREEQLDTRDLRVRKPAKAGKDQWALMYPEDLR